MRFGGSLAINFRGQKAVFDYANAFESTKINVIRVIFAIPFDIKLTLKTWVKRSHHGKKTIRNGIWTS
jgi:hypothetical protein